MADRIKGITVVIGGDTTGLSKALSGVNNEINSTEKQLKDVERLLKLDPTNTELLAQKQRLLGDEIQSTSKKLDALREAEKQVQQQFARGEVSQQQYDALQREIVATEQKLSSLQDAAKTAGVAMGQVGEAAKKIAEGTDELADGLDNVTGKAKVMSAAVVAGGTAAVKSAADLDSAVGTFMAKTGQAADSTDAWRGALEEIYKGNYGEDFADIANSMATVQKTLDGVDPGNIAELTEDAIALRDTFDYDVNESVRAAKALMDNFGISADDAFNLIAAGAQSNLDYSGELLDTISEYSVQFGKLGFTANDFFQIMQSGADSGAWNLDKVGDAIKELSIRVVDGSDTTQQGFEAIGLDADEMAAKFAQGGDTAREAFDETIAALAAMEDPVQQNIAGVNLFGTMWEDLGADATLALGEIQDEAYAADDALEQIKQQKYDNLIADLKSLGKTAINDIVIPLGEQLMPTIEKVVGVATQLVQKFSGMTTEEQNFVLAAAGIVAVLPGVLSLLGGLLSVIGTVSSGIAIFTGAMTTGSTAAMGFAKVLGFLKGALGLAGGLLKGLFTGFLNVGELLLDGISSVGVGIANFITGTVVPAVTSAATSLFTFLSGAISSFVTFITGTVVPGIISTLQGFFAFLAANPVILIIAAIVAAVVGLAVLINTYADQIRKVLQSINDWLQGVFATNWTEIFGPILGEPINAFMATVKSVWDGIMTALNGIITFVTGIFSGNWRQAWEGIKSIFKGVFDSLVGLAKSPLNTIIGLVNAVIGGINAMINGLNSISIDVPEGVPVLGGKSIGFDIPNLPSVPYLAKGGTVLSGSAIVGEAGPELLTVGPGGTRVLPLTSGERAASGRAVTIGEMNFYGYSPQEGRQIAREVNRVLGRLL